MAKMMMGGGTEMETANPIAMHPRSPTPMEVR